MAAVLLMVGRGQEAPEIVQQLLKIEQHPRKPQYNMLPEVCMLMQTCASLLHLHRFLKAPGQISQK